MINDGRSVGSDAMRCDRMMFVACDVRDVRAMPICTFTIQCAWSRFLYSNDCPVHISSFIISYNFPFCCAVHFSLSSLHILSRVSFWWLVWHLTLNNLVAILMLRAIHLINVMKSSYHFVMIGYLMGTFYASYTTLNTK